MLVLSHVEGATDGFAAGGECAASPEMDVAAVALPVLAVGEEKLLRALLEIVDDAAVEHFWEWHG